jgi:DNA-binding Lrp family transcriptional regulator
MTKESLDQSLIALLREDARAPTAALARRLGVARSTVQSRLDRLERTGVIRGYRVELDPSLAARQVQAHALISVDPAQQLTIERKLRSMATVTALYTVSGPYDLIAVLGASTTGELDAALDEVRACTGVKATATSIILTRRFER